MKKFAMLFLFVATLIATTAAVADEAAPNPTVKLGFYSQVLMPFGVKDGHWNGGGLGLANGLTLTFPLPANWSVGVEPGVQTGFASFQPNPQLALSASYKFTDQFILGSGILYRYFPDYAGGVNKDGHLASVSVAPIFPLGPIMLAFPMGPCYSTLTKKWGGVFTLKLSFPLATW